ncbi:hypothetical protein GCM10010168_22070 [Actinoplanes ianthinogenes]|uniref:SGNH/GDSL hydrolase family protein n=1 Tax=Actinoplanes ianthinogenes TaxID=122358 RepID=A0ABN6CRI6_9ACTN|nr:hypothetical protein [Actinoplanes ianthinogenes]BCJ47848.1 hypothetical protein Aiant_85050 [Actinoplanes ianthinogenes]GGR04575.1 hypothetical protein GCM10010168_22070 [Actinoplanes ianthinogenes]
MHLDTSPSRTTRTRLLVLLAALLTLLPAYVAATTPPSHAATSTPIAGVSLVNNVSRKPILGVSPVLDDAVIDLTRLANRHLSLQSTLSYGASAGSVRFTLSGATGSSYSRTENVAPYFLCNDYADCPLLATPDSYTLTVQAFSGANATGSALGSPSTVRFRVSATAVATPAVDVLFVGNSLIGTPTTSTGEDTPQVLRSLAAAAGRTVTVTKVIHFGNTLQQTWDAGEVAAAVNGTKKYDYVVLQEYSTLVPTDLPAATNTLLNTYAPAVAKVLKPGGRVVLFKDWALVDPAPFANRAAYVAALNTNYATLGARLGLPTIVAPISDTFETVIATKGTSYLIVADGKHPHGRAIYMNAATLYGILFRSSPRDLSNLYVDSDSTTAPQLRDVSATAIGY